MVLPAEVWLDGRENCCLHADLELCAQLGVHLKIEMNSVYETRNHSGIHRAVGLIVVIFFFFCDHNLIFIVIFISKETRTLSCNLKIETAGPSEKNQKKTAGPR